MIDKHETAVTQEISVYCNGKSPPLDHPKVFLHIDVRTSTVVCPYCSKKFIYKESDASTKNTNTIQHL